MAEEGGHFWNWSHREGWYFGHMTIDYAATGCILLLWLGCHLEVMTGLQTCLESRYTVSFLGSLVDRSFWSGRKSGGEFGCRRGRKTANTGREPVRGERPNEVWLGGFGVTNSKITQIRPNLKFLKVENVIYLSLR